MTVDWKKKLIPNLPYLLFVYLFDKLCQAVRLAPGLDASEKFLHLSQGFTEAFFFWAAKSASAGPAGGYRRGGHCSAGGVCQEQEYKEISQGH